MKSIGISIVVLLTLTGILSAQSKVGIHAGVAIPTGAYSEHHRTGFGVGGLATFETSDPTLVILAGADYIDMPPGPTTIEYVEGSGPGHISGGTTTITTYKHLRAISAYAGPKLGNKTGPYFSPQLSLNFAGEFRLGFYLGGGLVLPLETVALHFGAKFGILNLIGKVGDESSANGIGIFAGIVF